MKKSVVLAMAMALGVTASAYAANPFTDVPAGHWAYDSISKLAAAGVIEGYGDDTFRGDRLMTRYEMAQIVARAMAKGANVDKLAAEFADELEKLNVRVSALEKKSDNVKITGEIRYRWAERGGRFYGNRQVEHALRSRLYFNGKVNDNWNYVGRISNDEQNFRDDIGNERTTFDVAKMEGRVGGVNVVAGRDDDVFADGYIYDGKHDAIKLSYGDKWYINGAYGKLTDLNDNVGAVRPNYYTKKFGAVEIGSNIEGAFANGKIGYLKADSGNLSDFPDKVGIFYLAANLNVAKDLAFDAMYLRSNRDQTVGMVPTGEKSSKNGYVLGLSYKGADEAEPGSWGLSLNYYNQGRGTYLAHTIDGETGFQSGFKGWAFGGDVTVAKNMVFSAKYYDTKAKNSNGLDAGADRAKVIWSEFNMTV